MKSFETTQGSKQVVRDALVQVAKTHLPTVYKILTLPGRECLCVQTFNRAFPKVAIRGIERQKEDWLAITTKGVDCLLGTVQDYAAQHTVPALHHDVIFLDYCSFLNDDVLEGVKAIVSNPHIILPGKKTVLGITLQKGIRHDRDEMLEFIAQNVYLSRGERPVNNLEMVGCALQSWITKHNANYLESSERVDALEYRAEEGSAQMYFFCFLLEK